MTTELSHTRFIKQQDFVPYATLAEKPVTVVGVGAIGRQVALQLASIGASKIQLIDFDRVDEGNVTTQGFLAVDIGDEKVVAAARAIHAIDPTIEVEFIIDRFRPNQQHHPVIFMCVDKIGVRKIIWEARHDKAELILDGRMLGETMQVLAASKHHPKTQDYYPTSLFAPDEQMEGRCTGHATIYCATIAAGLMVHQFTRWLRGFPIDHHMGLNLFAGEFFPIGEAV